MSRQAYSTLLQDALTKSGELYGGGQQLVGQGQGILSGSLPYLTGAAASLSDLQNFYRPFMDSGQRAIDAFLPSAARVNEVSAPEYGNINQGYRSVSDSLARFAPRGGGRVSTLARADIDRQKQLSDTFFGNKQNLRDVGLNAAFQGASGQGNMASLLSQLGLGQGQLGLGTIGQGLSQIGQGTNYLGTGGGLAQNAFGQGLQALGLQQQSAAGLSNLATSALGGGLNGGNSLLDLYNSQANRSVGQNALAGASTADLGKNLGGLLSRLFQPKKSGSSSGSASTSFVDSLFGGGEDYA
jgi:hypothetical protein